MTPPWISLPNVSFSVGLGFLGLEPNLAVVGLFSSALSKKNESGRENYWLCKVRCSWD